MSKLEELIKQANNTSENYSSKLKKLISLDSEIFKLKESIYFQKCKEAELDFIDFFTPQDDFELGKDDQLIIASSGNLKILFFSSYLYSEPLLIYTEGLCESDYSKYIFIRPIKDNFSYRKSDIKSFLTHLDPNKRSQPKGKSSIETKIGELKDELTQFTNDFQFLMSDNREYVKSQCETYSSMYDILVKLFS